MPEIAPQAPATVTTRDWVSTVTTQKHLHLQTLIIKFLLWAYGLLLAATIGIFYLQGFQVGHFMLEVRVLLWLGAATIGEIGGLLLLTFRVIFKR